MTLVDSAVLNLTERLCRRFQVLTGRTNVWLAFQLTNLSIVMYFVWVIGLFVDSVNPAVRTFVAIVGGAVFFGLTRTIFRTSVEASEAEAYRRVAKGLRNPRRVRDAQLRISFLTLAIVLPYPLWLAYVTPWRGDAVLNLRFVAFSGAMIILAAIILYVLACDPLPPSVGKVKEWLRGMSPARESTNAVTPVRE
jgi:hypothetical protein